MSSGSLLAGAGVTPASDGAAADEELPATVSRIERMVPFAAPYCPTATQSVASAHDAWLYPGPAGDDGAGLSPDSEAVVVEGPRPLNVVTVVCRPENWPCGKV